MDNKNLTMYVVLVAVGVLVGYIIASSQTTGYGIKISHAGSTGYTICRDGIDNDRDGLIDMNDYDCSSPYDFSEYPECSDGIDNDGDGSIDIRDRDCVTPRDMSEG